MVIRDRANNFTENVEIESKHETVLPGLKFIDKSPPASYLPRRNKAKSSKKTMFSGMIYESA